MKSLTTHFNSKTQFIFGRRQHAIVRAAEPKKKSLVSIEQELIARIEKDEVNAPNKITKANWDEVEEIAAARSRRGVRDRAEHQTEIESFCSLPENQNQAKCRLDDD